LSCRPSCQSSALPTELLGRRAAVLRCAGFWFRPALAAGDRLDAGCARISLHRNLSCRPSCQSSALPTELLGRRTAVLRCAGFWFRPALAVGDRLDAGCARISLRWKRFRRRAAAKKSAEYSQ
jgi:hypothetical protein